MGRFSGKVALVTGSTVGIGFAIAERFVAEGARVVANVDAALKRLQAVAATSGGAVHGTTCHVGRREDQAALLDFTVKKCGGSIDFLVHNAAVSPHMGATLDTPDKVIDKIMAVNLKAPFVLTQLAVPHMRKGGSIILVSSIGAYLPFAMLGWYSVSKTAMLALTKVLSKELAAEGLRVNCIAPGVIKTRFSSPMWDTAEAKELASGNSFMNRIGTPAECAGVVAFLCSDDASYITGETLPVCGGSDARL